MSNKYCEKHNAGWSDKHYSLCPYCQQEENMSDDIEKRFNLITELLKDNAVLLNELADKVNKNAVKINSEAIIQIVSIMKRITDINV